jgi:phosphate transport system substrate-binding protein
MTKYKEMSIVTFIQNFIIIACRNIFSTSFITVTRISSMQSFYKGMRFLTMALVISVASCKGKNTIPQESPTRGDIKITVDESFQPLLDTEVYTFTQLYTNAKIKPQYKPEYDVINDFMNDSVKVIVTSRKLTEDQIQYLRDTLVIARTTKFAYDALALVSNKENMDTLIPYKSIRDIFSGNALTWKEIDPKSKLGKISVIFDNTKSGNIRYFKELFEIKNKLPDNFFAVNSNVEVIDFVSRNPDAIGIISVNWISDKDDSTSMSFIKKVNIVAVSQELLTDGSYYRPYQGSIYDKSYPFVREIYFISRETFKGLGSGFIQWATAEQGQRIVLKSGLVPATMPIRLVQIKN